MLGFFKGICSVLGLLIIGLIFVTSPVTYDRYVAYGCLTISGAVLCWHCWHRLTRGYWFCDPPKVFHPRRWR